VNTARKLHRVELNKQDQSFLHAIINTGTGKARTITRARILQMSHYGKTDDAISDALHVNPSTPYEIRKRYHLGGLQRALYDGVRPGQKKVFTDQDETTITALACTKAPDGHSRWTLDLLVAHAKDKLNKSIGRNTIWKILLRHKLQPWRKKNVVYSYSHT